MRQNVYRLLVCVACLGGLVGCEESTRLPATPSPLPPDKVGVLAISCPADVTTQSLNGVDARIDYPPPRVTGGQPPVVMSCTPDSGAILRIGSAVAECTAGDELGQAVSCRFGIEVQPPARIAATRFLAFGDSLTAGVTSASVSTILEPSKSYPVKLAQRLEREYPTQRITVVNAGFPGELATEGAFRLGSQINGVRPEVVLIMEGTNDVGSNTFSLSATIAALEAMVGEVQARGLDAMIATLPPLRPEGSRVQDAQDLVELNQAIRSIGFARRIPVVEVFSALSQASCVPTLSSLGFPDAPGRGGLVTTFPCIGRDGIHPTAQGYEVMAQTFFDAIVDVYDIDVAGSRLATAHPATGRMP